MVNFVLSLNQSSVARIMGKDLRPKTGNPFKTAAILCGLGLGSLGLTLGSSQPPRTDLGSLVESGKVAVCRTQRASFRFDLLIAKQPPFEVRVKSIPAESPIHSIARDCLSR